MFILGIDPRNDQTRRVGIARKEFDQLQDGRKDVEPDIIVLHNAFWTLFNMAMNGSRTEDQAMANGVLLPLSFIREYSNQLKGLAHRVRETFPTTPVLIHTAAMVRHDAYTGHTEGKRAWINRLFIDQLNQASRQVCFPVDCILYKIGSPRNLFHLVLLSNACMYR